MKSTVKLKQTREEWLTERKGYLGGSEIGKVAGVSRWGCPRSVTYEKLGTPKDFDDSDKAEFSRGNRLEGIAAEYYEQVTGREVRYTTRAFVEGKPHLSINMDRIVKDPKREGSGYLEIKVLGRFSMAKVKREGLSDDYVLQVQYGLAVKGLSWGAYAIYCPETDELLHWDVEADTALGETLLEKGDDFWSLHVECGVLPEKLPDGAVQCEGCNWSVTCRGSEMAPASAEVVDRPDLEAIAAKFAEVKGMGSEVEQAEEALRAELLAAIKEVPGKYKAGKYEFSFTVSEQKRFSSERLKKENPALYESLREKSIVKKITKPKEV